MLRVNPAIFVEVEATGEVSISSYVSTQATGDNFLQHSEAEYVVRQPQISIIGAHRSDHVQVFVPHKELERRGAGDFRVDCGNVLSIEYLDDGADAMWGDLLAVRSRFGLDRFPADRTIEDHNRHKPQHRLRTLPCNAIRIFR